MKKLFFILCLIVCAHSAATELPSQVESPVEQLVRIMMSNILAQKRNPNDYQEVYSLVTNHPKLLKGIIHDGRTFAMLCVQRGYADLLTRLINEDYPVDITTPCNLYANPDEPETTVLHILFLEVSGARKFNCCEDDYTACITGLTKLIINKDPLLLDMPVKKSRTARDMAIFLWRNLGDLIPPELPQATTNTLESELLDACKAYDCAAVEELIKKPGIDVNRGDEHGCTPLIIASQHGDFHLLEALLSLKKSDGSFAVNINQSNRDGITALLAACQKCDSFIVEALLAVPGIDVNQADDNGETPLLMACKNKAVYNDGSKVIRLLLENGAVNKENKKGETPLQITKDTPIYGLLEIYLVGEVHASRYCSALSAEECKRAKRAAGIIS